MIPAVFSPSDEPYLGRDLLRAFDELICACLELNSRCAPKSHDPQLTDFQRALCILVPQTITLALSIRELIRQGYLFGAKVLVRPLTERAVTVLYLSRILARGGFGTMAGSTGNGPRFRRCLNS
jgi:hypothetical protein